MVKPPERQHFPLPDDHSLLQDEITAIEVELNRIQKDVQEFTRLIHIRLDPEITRINELKEIYKDLKRQKKAKRLEQKKRGKNYQEPTGLTIADSTPTDIKREVNPQLRKIYKEAMVQFHPDKISHTGEDQAIARATAITKELNRIYQNGDLDELVDFYQAILNGQPVLEAEIKSKMPIQDREYLIKRKWSLEEQLAGLKESYLYQVLVTYENPMLFIEELQAQFRVRIQVMEKRTRKAGRK
ncbi:hypothetical protein [Litoribacter populi]|uniref:hypothetical protein n=1 Tax=Litoribacter populi TaxID=2598460 RepID=UPI00117BE8BB|nr:hypothetical protein [Litoribacter populi]